MLYGYARVSSKDQNLIRQTTELLEYGISKENIYSDKESGKSFDRKNYQRIKKKIKAGDVLVIKSIDRLGRNYEMIISEWAYLTKFIKCDIVVLDMKLLDTRNDANGLIGRFISDIVLQILSFVAENERNNIKERQREGILLAQKNGIKFGRPAINITNEYIAVFEEYNKKECSLTEALNKTKLSRGTFYKYYKFYYKEKLDT